MKESGSRRTEERGDLETVQGLCEGGFQVIIYGGHEDPAVLDVAGFTGGTSVVILDRETEVEVNRRRIALMSSGSEEDEAFARFVSRFIEDNLEAIYELRIINPHGRAAVAASTSGESGHTTGAASRREPA